MKLSAVAAAAVVALAALSSPGADASSASASALRSSLSASASNGPLRAGLGAVHDLRSQIGRWLTTDSADDVARKLQREFATDAEAVRKVMVDVSVTQSAIHSRLRDIAGSSYTGRQAYTRTIQMLDSGEPINGAVDGLVTEIVALAKQLDAVKKLNGGKLPEPGYVPHGFEKPWDHDKRELLTLSGELLEAIQRRTKKQTGRGANAKIYKDNSGNYVSLADNQMANTIVSKMQSGGKVDKFSNDELRAIADAVGLVNAYGDKAPEMSRAIAARLGNKEEYVMWVRGERSLPSIRVRNRNPKAREPKPEPTPDTPAVKAAREAAEKVAHEVATLRRRENKLLAIMWRADKKSSAWSFDAAAADVQKHFDEAADSVRKMMDSATFRPSQFTEEMLENLRRQKRELDELRGLNSQITGGQKRLPAGTSAMSKHEKELLERLEKWWAGPPKPQRDFDGRFYSSMEMQIYHEIKSQGIGPLLQNQGKAEWVFRTIMYNDMPLERELRELVAKHAGAIQRQADSSNGRMTSWEKLSMMLKEKPRKRPNFLKEDEMAANVQWAGRGGHNYDDLAHPKKMYERLRSEEDWVLTPPERATLSDALERTSWSPDDVHYNYYAGYDQPNQIRWSDVALVQALFNNDKMTNRLFGSQWRTPTGAAAHKPSDDLLRSTWKPDQ